MRPKVNGALFRSRSEANGLSNLNIIRHKLLQFVNQFTVATFAKMYGASGAEGVRLKAWPINYGKCAQGTA